MVISCRNPLDFAPTGVWTFQLVGTEASQGAPYEHGSGVFVDVTNASSAKEWTYTPGRLTDSDTVAYTQNVPGGYKVAQVSNGRAKVEERLSLAIDGGGTYARCIEFVADTYAAFSWDIIKPLLDAPGKNKPLMSGSALNPDCWAAGFNWSGLVIWNSSSNSAVQRGVLITPRHLWITKHYRYNAGTRVRFPDGTERTVVAIAYDGAAGDTTQDECVALLNSDVPGSITPFQVAGEWLATHEPYGENYRQLMFGSYLYVDQFNDAHLCPAVSNPGSGVISFSDEMSGVHFYDGCGPTETTTYATVFEGYDTWMKLPVPGDSSSGVFVPLDEETLAVATVLTGIYGGESYQSLDGLIVKADTAYGISTGYTVTVATDPTS